MRENRTYGSEGGATRVVPTPIMLILLALQAHAATSNRIPAFAGMTVQAFGAERILLRRIESPGSTIFATHDTSADYTQGDGHAGNTTRHPGERRDPC